LKPFLLDSITPKISLSR